MVVMEMALVAPFVWLLKIEMFGSLPFINLLVATKHETKKLMLFAIFTKTDLTNWTDSSAISSGK